MALLDSYFERKAEVLAQRREELTNDPKAGKVRLTATSYCAGITGVRPTKMGDHIIASDSAPGLAGHSLGPSSPEMLLGGLASCLVHTYLLQATLMKIPMDGVEIEVYGTLDMTGVVGLPHEEKILLEELSYKADVQSSAPQGEVDRLHDAVEQTCAVLNTLRNPVPVARL